MRRTARLLSLVVPLLAHPAAGAEALSLDDVTASVEATYPLLAAARADVELARGEVLAAEGAFDPAWRTRLYSVTLGDYNWLRLESQIEAPTPWWGATFLGGYRLGLGKFAGYDGKLQTFDYGELRAGLLLPLWRNGPTDRRRANIERARLGTSAADLAVAQLRLEAVRAASQRYWEWVAAGRRVAIARALVELARIRDTALAERVRRGDLPAYERVDNARAIQQREAPLVVVTRALEQAAIELGLYLRDEQGAPRRPPAELLPAALPEPVALDPERVREEARGALERRPEPRRFEVGRAQQEVESRLARNQLAPAVDLAVAASYDLPDRTAGHERGKVELEAGLSVEVPVRTRAQRGRLDAARAAARRAEEQRRFARDRVIADLDDAASALEAARRRFEASRQESRLARELEEGERTRFGLGESTLLFVNLREQAAFEAAQRELDAQLDWHRARASYEAAAALRLGP